MGNTERYKRGHGQDLIPTFGRKIDVAGMQERNMRPLGAETRKPAASPAPDTRLGGRIAHVGTAGAPNVYEEKFRGRMGGRGKRTGA